jgi:hypothetical protein
MKRDGTPTHHPKSRRVALPRSRLTSKFKEKTICCFTLDIMSFFMNFYEAANGI